MDENNYIKLPSGEFVEERRGKTTMDIQQTLLKLVSNVESMEKNVETQLIAVIDRISNVDEKLVNKINYLEEKMNDHFQDEKKTDESIADHDKKLMKAETYIEKIKNLEDKYNVLQNEIVNIKKIVSALGNKEKTEVYNKWNKIKDKVFWAVIGLIGAAILFAISQPGFWQNLRIGG